MDTTNDREKLSSFLSPVKIPEEFFWEGDMGDYLKIALECPAVLSTAHQRFHQAMEHWGKEKTRFLRQPLIHYNVFDDPFTPTHKHAIYGVDRALMQVAKIFRAAAYGFGQEHRLYLMRGPVGTAKSTFGELTADMLEAFSRTEAGKLYTLSWHVEKSDEEGQHILGITDHVNKTEFDCPIHGEPIHVIPKEIRQAALGKFLPQMEEKFPYPLKILDKNECPRCSDIFWRFLSRYKGDWMKILVDHVRVKRLLLSRRQSIGIAVTRPKAEKDQDATEWSGETNFVALAKYGSISDPRTFDFKGYFEVANRGMLYSEELLKLSQTFLYDYLGASQEHRIQPKGFVEVDIDEVIFGGTNNPEWEKLRDTKEMEALRDRIIHIPMPYILKLSDEEKIYRKFFVVGDKRMQEQHMAPHTLEIAAYVGVISRLTKSKKGELSLRDKLKLYDGKQVPGFNEDSIMELMREAEQEGQEGLSPRYIHDKISAAVVGVSLEEGKQCVNFFRALRELREGLVNHPHIKNETERKVYEERLAMAEEELMEMLKDEVQQVMVGDDEALTEIHRKYIDNALAYKHGEKVKNPVTEQDEEPDESFMRGIEQMIDISDGAKDTFREKILNAMAKRARDRDLDPKVLPFSYKTDERLHKAYKLRLFEQEKDRINWEALISKKAVGEDAQKRINALRTGLKEQKGYCDVCSAEVITYVASIFHRGEKAKK